MNDTVKKRDFTSVLVVLICSMIMVFSQTATYAQDNFVVVLDAGHGGKDPGRPAKNFSEKDIALSIVLNLGKKLKELDDVNVVYTRDKDVFVDLKERGRIANDADADLFVSIHCNAFHNDASGTETYVLGLHANKQNFEVAKHENSVIFLEDNYQEKYEGFDPNSPEAVIGMTLMQEEFLDQSLSLASNIQTNFRDQLKRKDRGVKQAGFVVLHQTYMPSVLIETGFITNNSEGAFLNSKSGQNKVSGAIFNAIKSYKKNIDENLVIEESPIAVVESSNVYPGIDFKVQISSGKKKLETKSYNFKGLKGVKRGKIKNIYKYYYGKSSDFDLIVKKQSEARKAGFSTAFVVAFRGQERIKLSEVINK